MKKLISILLVVVMLVAMVPAMAFTTSATSNEYWTDKEWDLTWYTEVMGKTTVGADETEAANNDGIVYVYETSKAGSDRISVNITTGNKTFYIDNAAELSGLAKICAMEDKSYFTGSTFYIRSDIDLLAYTWFPIAHKKGAFRANVEGVKQSDDTYPEISNMVCNSTGNVWTGLIGAYKTGYVKNLSLVDANVTANEGHAGGFIAFVADTSVGFENLTFDGSLTINNGEADNIGGILGNCTGAINEGVINCDVTAESTFTIITKAQRFGGIIGYCKAVNGSGIKNCDFAGTVFANANSYVEHSGGIVGWQDGAVAKYENCTFTGSIDYYDSHYLGGIIGVVTAAVTNGVVNCDASGTLRMDRADKYRNHSVVGGIIGGNGYNSTATAVRIQLVDGCDFTGVLDAPYVDRLGGIIGWIGNVNIADTTVIVTIQNCVSIPEEFTWGINNWYQSNSGAEWRCGAAGIVGMTEIGNGTSGKLVIDGCYVSGDVTVDPGKNYYNKTNAGFVGNNCGPVDFIDCQYDAVAWDSSEKVAAFVGRYAGALTFANCVNTGIAFNAGSANGYGKNAMLWVGQGNISATMTNCYTSANELLYYGAADTYRPTQIMSSTEFTGLDFTNTWIKREGSMYPVLTVAKDLAPADSITRGGVDMSWLNTNLLSMKITTAAQLKGVNRAYNAFLARDKENVGETVSTYQTMLISRISFSPTLAAADMTGFNANAKELINAKLGISDKVDTEGNIFDMVNDNAAADNVFAQVSLAKNDNGLYDMRVVITIKDKEALDGVKFEVAASRGDQFGTFVESDLVTKCYKTVVEVKGENDTEEHIAEDGAYYVICVINNIDLSADTTFTVRANAIVLDGETETVITQSTAVNFVVDARN